MKRTYSADNYFFLDVVYIGWEPNPSHTHGKQAF